MVGTTAQPSHEAPHKKETKTGSHHSEKYQWRKSHRETGGGGEDGGRRWLKEILCHGQCSTKENLHATECS